MDHHSYRNNEEYQAFDNFVKENPPILTFQRELLEVDRTDRILPIEYTAWLPEFGGDPKEDFDKRPLAVSYNWGRSSESRVYMHAAIFNNAPRRGYDVVSEFSHVEKAVSENPDSEKWLSVHVPHYARIDVKEVQKFVRMSKIAIIMPGAGVKTFRHGENCGDAIMAIPQDRLAWSYPWTSENSIRLDSAWTSGSLPVDELCDFLRRKDLHDIYVNAMENARNYRYETYMRRWVCGNIEKFL